MTVLSSSLQLVATLNLSDTVPAVALDLPTSHEAIRDYRVEEYRGREGTLAWP